MEIPYIGHVDGIIVAVGVGFAIVAVIVGFAILGRGKDSSQQFFHDFKAPARSDGAPDPFIHGSARERRIASRRRGNPVGVLISDAEFKAPPFHGLVVDRSAGGLGLEVDRPLEEGIIISIKVANSPESSPWVQLAVRGCRKVNTTFEIGGQFVKAPAFGIMLLFG